jgi:hypothetical protein
METFNYRQAMMTKADMTKLVANHVEPSSSHKPVVKLFDCMGPATWLISECDENGMAFGLCDLGLGTPELGYVYIPELIEALGRRLEKDRYFEAKMSMPEYAKKARSEQKINA